MERTSQVLLRNEARLPSGQVLLVNAPRDALCQKLQLNTRDARVSTQDFGDQRWLTASGIPAWFEVLPGGLDSCTTVILHLPREKDRLVMMLHVLSARMPSGALLWLVGSNQAGIKSAGKHLENCFSNVTKLDNARHCGLFQASGPLREKPFSLSDYEETWAVEYAGKTIQAVSLPGVFAHARLDKGSEILLRTLEGLVPTGRILDFACGSGILGSALLAASEKVDLTLLDVSALAIESSRLTLQRNGLTAVLLPSDGLAELEGRFDWIISNPPFHRGVDNDLEIAARFFKEAGTFLAKNGRIVIVCNRHLPYMNWLRNEFEQVDHLAGNDDFMVIEARKPH